MKTLEELASKKGLKNILAATVNGRLRELTYLVNGDEEILFLDYTNSDAIRIYESTLRFVIAMAIYRLYPETHVKFNYNISRSILAIVDNIIPLDQFHLAKIKDEVDKIISENHRIIRKKTTVEKAKQIYQEQGLFDKIDILNYREEKDVNLYEANGYTNYMFGYMLPSTGYITNYKFILYHPGFLVQYPRAEENGLIPKFEQETNFGKALKDAYKWSKIINGNTIADINEHAKSRKEAIDFVNMCESKHSSQLHDLGNQIEADIDSIRLILVAGPSSSGKTTFTNRLRIELRKRGIQPVMISLDDYYKERDEAPKNSDGSPDLEHVLALDTKQFNEDMLALILGHEVTLPHFNFKKGKREKGQTLKISPTTPILIEGIHALNDILTTSILRHQKFKIYISPQTQLHIDNHNPISITELRLLRRIVRDQRYRNSSALDTMEMWKSVRSGEFKWIYPFQKDADYIFNSELTYELSVLKKHAVKQLNEIDRNSKHFIAANRLLKFLKYFKDIDDDTVPCNSLLREFIGGSSFHD